jgi:hypothetical protein
VWRRLKDILHTEYPHLAYLGKNSANQTEFERCLAEAWDKIPQAFVDSLIDSVPRRIEAVGQANGWYTKY